jgi:hypothetical protein
MASLRRFRCVKPCSASQAPVDKSLQARKGKKITKKSIMAALGIATTALAEAKHATKIIAAFGNEGSRHSQEVVSMLEKEEVQGTGVLMTFLVQWEKDHAAM